jgi:hypothetical protein
MPFTGPGKRMGPRKQTLNMQLLTRLSSAAINSRARGQWEDLIDVIICHGNKVDIR